MKIIELLEQRFDRNAHHSLKAPASKKIEAIKSSDELAEIIKAHCGTMLQAYQKTGKVLYRGMRTYRNVVTTSKSSYEAEESIITGIRKNRLPVEMNRMRHELLKKAFDSLDLTVNRTNSIFSTTDFWSAGTWGNEYVIFVKDGWTGLVFKNAAQEYSFDSLQYAGGEVVRKVLDAEKTSSFYKANKHSAIELLASDINKLKPFEFSTSSELVTILNSGYKEVLFAGDSYIAVTQLYFKNTMAELLDIQYR